MYQIEKDVPITNGRSGPKLGKFPLNTMEVGDSFLIPNVKRTIRGKEMNTPEAGINIKAANASLAPKVFKKAKVEGGVRVHRIA